MWKCGNVEIPILCYDKISIKLSPRPKKKKLIIKSICEFYFSFPEGITVWWAVACGTLSHCPIVSVQHQVPDSFLNPSCIFAALVTGIGRVTKRRYFSVPSSEIAGWWQAHWICKMNGFYSLPNARPIQLGQMVSPQFRPHFLREAAWQTSLWALL